MLTGHGGCADGCCRYLVDPSVPGYRRDDVYTRPMFEHLRDRSGPEPDTDAAIWPDPPDWLSLDEPIYDNLGNEVR